MNLELVESKMEKLAQAIAPSNLTDEVILMLGSVIGAFYQDAINMAIQAVEEEPELPGPIPDRVYNDICKSKSNAEKICREVVKTSKQGIIDRIQQRVMFL